jgi:hypothetical protein
MKLPLRPALLHQRPVGLDPERVHREHHRLPPVIERPDEELHLVVGADAVALGERRADVAVRLVGAHAEVDRGGRVPDEDLCGVGGGDAVLRRELREAGEEGGLLPDGLVELAVHHDLGGGTGRLDLRLPRAAVVDRRIGDDEREQQRDGEHGDRARGSGGMCSLPGDYAPPLIMLRPQGLPAPPPRMQRWA